MFEPGSKSFAITLLKSLHAESEQNQEALSKTITLLENTSDQEKLRRLLELLIASTALLGGNLNKAVIWLNSPATFISDSLPIEMIGSDRQVVIVLEAISKLEHGTPL